ncbi:hypothetical protein EDEG_03679 [Edhazardia aedis USNM 41457]|uniref:Uncharacterized protein n=1 Tax=Edhazardia aedis (strain USNM 41457) TaxID=1003232 RepID=J8ZQ61_EDHAE|nr:hypothetical protein EDEG_03679 [Edhazardia aedis USNM 41457]|eukprot:EJW01833.1 hypothetical protein EDEG_03679 [Edhazardia aedis USNM 41457]
MEEVPKERKRRVPGIQEHIKQLVSLKNDITKIQNEISDYEQRINEEFAKQRNNDERNALYSEKDAISREIDALSAEKEMVNSELKILLDESKKLKDEMSEHKKSKFDNPVSIQAKMTEIENKIISERLTAKKEAEYRQILLEMKRKLSNLGNLQGKEAQVGSLEDQIKAKKQNLFEVNKVLKERLFEMRELKDHLNKLKEKGREKSPLILSYEQKISDLKKLKEEKNKIKQSVHETIKQIEDEHNKHLAEIEKVTKMEADLKDQKAKIKRLNEEAVKLEEERANFDPNKFDTIISAVSKLNSTANMPISLIQKLAENGVSLPKSKDDIQSVITQLNKKKEEFVSQVSAKTREFNLAITQKRAEIEEQRKILSEMPVPEVKLRDLYLKDGFKKDDRFGAPMIKQERDVKKRIG